MTGSNLIRLPPGFFVTATGTGVGKTFVSRGLTAALHARGRRVAALKPIETGVPFPVNPVLPTDASLLARAAAWLELEHATGFYRAALPASPYGVSLATCSPPLELEPLALAIEVAAQGADLVLVEGAGGLLVPVDRERTLADLATRLGLPLLLVAPNALGVLSHVLTAIESAERRALSIAALVLTELEPATETADAADPTRAHNAAILRERLRCPVLSFPFCVDSSDRALATAATRAGLLELAKRQLTERHAHLP